MASSLSPAELKAEILRLARQFAREVHRPNLPAEHREAEPGDGGDAIPYAGRVFDEEEVEAAVASSLDFWLTLGPEGDAFERALADFLGVRRSLLVNSGSSANLLALSALTSARLGERRLRPGDEVITVAAGFPTTVAPILQNGLVPVFVDNDPVTLNARVDQLGEAYVPGRTRAVLMAHTLGNPFDLAAVRAFCDAHELWLIEDNCDALGSTYTPAAGSGGSGVRPGLTGSFGDLSTQSFYPPHHLTTGEGGAVNVVDNMLLKVLVESFRDWGRDCWCASGKDNTCGKRFGWQLGELPEGYDHKYTYSHFGYNLKPLDLQAAIGLRQLRKLPGFVEARRRNWQQLRAGLDALGEHFAFQLPTHAVGWSPEGFRWRDPGGASCDPSWFGFMLHVRAGAPFRRTDLARALDAAKIGNRMLFGGNLLRQPAFVQLRKDRPESFRIRGLAAARNASLTSADIAALLPGADAIMNEVLFVGTYPGLSSGMIGRIVDAVTRFVRSH